RAIAGISPGLLKVWSKGLASLGLVTLVRTVAVGNVRVDCLQGCWPMIRLCTATVSVAGKGCSVSRYPQDTSWFTSPHNNLLSNNPLYQMLWAGRCPGVFVGSHRDTALWEVTCMFFFRISKYRSSGGANFQVFHIVLQNYRIVRVFVPT
ncbi:unnamed protein product, partial [Discosporangium mesarthrocarpum]